MRSGIRLQIVLVLLGLLALAFLPLFIAVASLTRVALSDARESSARSLGRAVAAHVAERAVRDNPEALDALLSAQLGAGGVAAIGVYGDAGQATARAGAPSALELLPEAAPINLERIRSLQTPMGPAVEVIVPGPSGAVITLLQTGDDLKRTAPLLRLVALYTTAGALALLTFTYIALGRLIVRPIDALSAAARRVAAGARSLQPPRSGPAELLDLGASLAEMTAKLRSDEERMREHVEEIERRATELREAQDRLVRSERLASVGRLAAGVAHEIGNPVTAILGLHDILLEGGLDPEEERDLLFRTRSEAERIHYILQDLLAFARPAGQVDEENTFGDIIEAVEDAVALVKPQKDFRGIHFTLDMPAGPLMTRLSRERLVQVILNLLLNAADVATQCVRISASAAENVAWIKVEDDGPGVDESVRSRLFEPFTTTKETGQGTGLGLAVCRGLVEAVGGLVFLDESHEEGARFIVQLPLQASEALDHGS